jgi:hypothetical protein
VTWIGFDASPLYSIVILRIFQPLVVIMTPIAVLYPRGGAFNKLRGEQTLLENLLKDCLHGYCQLKATATEKKNYVKAYILDRLDDCGHAFMIFDGDHPERGKLVQPSESEAYKKIMQKLRSMKKERCTYENNNRFFTMSYRVYK